MEDQAPKESTDQAEPELLYHYTTEKGLYGILESDTIWATHYRFLNDVSECTETLCLVDRIVKQRQSRSDSSGKQSQASKDFRNATDDRILKNIGRLLDSVDVYLACLTDESSCPSPGDRLSQWRGYGQDGRVFSLELRRDKLKSQIEEFGKGNQIPTELWGCLYGETPESRMKREAIAWDLWGHCFSQLIRDPVQPGSDLEKNLLQWTSRFKNEGFFEEHEWRLVLHVPPRDGSRKLIRFHDGKFGRTPHIAIPIDLKSQNSPLKRIVVGPTPDKAQAVDRLKINLDRMGIKSVEVVPSQIPYRNW
jgi:Protein of unknown function (DUF2971)